MWRRRRAERAIVLERWDAWEAFLFNSAARGGRSAGLWPSPSDRHHSTHKGIPKTAPDNGKLGNSRQIVQLDSVSISHHESGRAFFSLIGFSRRTNAPVVDHHQQVVDVHHSVARNVRDAKWVVDIRHRRGRRLWADSPGIDDRQQIVNVLAGRALPHTARPARKPTERSAGARVDRSSDSPSVFSFSVATIRTAQQHRTTLVLAIRLGPNRFDSSKRKIEPRWMCAWAAIVACAPGACKANPGEITPSPPIFD